MNALDALGSIATIPETAGVFPGSLAAPVAASAEPERLNALIGMLRELMEPLEDVPEGDLFEFDAPADTAYHVDALVDERPTSAAEFPQMAAAPQQIAQAVIRHMLGRSIPYEPVTGWSGEPLSDAQLGKRATASLPSIVHATGPMIGVPQAAIPPISIRPTFQVLSDLAPDSFDSAQDLKKALPTMGTRMVSDGAPAFSETPVQRKATPSVAAEIAEDAPFTGSLSVINEDETRQAASQRQETETPEVAAHAQAVLPTPQQIPVAKTPLAEESHHDSLVSTQARAPQAPARPVTPKRAGLETLRNPDTARTPERLEVSRHPTVETPLPTASFPTLADTENGEASSTDESLPASFMTGQPADLFSTPEPDSSPASTPEPIAPHSSLVVHPVEPAVEVVPPPVIFPASINPTQSGQRTPLDRQANDAQAAAQQTRNQPWPPGMTGERTQSDTERRTSAPLSASVAGTKTAPQAPLAFALRLTAQTKPTVNAAAAPALAAPDQPAKPALTEATQIAAYVAQDSESQPAAHSQRIAAPVIGEASTAEQKAPHARVGAMPSRPAAPQEKPSANEPLHTRVVTSKASADQKNLQYAVPRVERVQNQNADAQDAGASTEQEPKSEHGEPADFLRPAGGAQPEQTIEAAARFSLRREASPEPPPSFSTPVMPSARAEITHTSAAKAGANVIQALRSSEALALSRPAPAAPSTPAQEIAVRVSQPGAAPVDVHVSQRRGEIQVAVRTVDTELQSNLRQELHTLVDSLEGSGYRTEAVAPREPVTSVRTAGFAGLEASSFAAQPMAPMSGQQNRGGESGEQPGSRQQQHNQQQQNQQQQQQQRRAPWMLWQETLEQTR